MERRLVSIEPSGKKTTALNVKRMSTMKAIVRPSSCIRARMQVARWSARRGVSTGTNPGTGDAQNVCGAAGEGARNHEHTSHKTRHRLRVCTSHSQPRMSHSTSTTNHSTVRASGAPHALGSAHELAQPTAGDVAEANMHWRGDGEIQDGEEHEQVP